MANVCPTTGTYSEEHKFRCLARHVCNLPNQGERDKFFGLYAKKNGLQAQIKLRNQARKEWPTRKQPIEEIKC